MSDLWPVRPDWWDDAVCRSMDTAGFFPDGGGWSTVNAYRRAVAVCGTCPVRTQCAEAGANEPFGVWGGTTPSDRGYGRGAVEARGDVRRRRLVHGTNAGYHAHRRNGETPCDECKAAHALYGAIRRETA